MAGITRLQYLKNCIEDFDIISEKNWYYKAFTLPVLKNEEVGDRLNHDIVIKMDGLYVYNGGELDRITDWKKDQPLFNWQEEIEIDSSWLSSVKGTITTKIGILFINAIVLHNVVGDKIPYFNKYKMGVGDLETLIMSYTKNEDEMTPTSISVKDMIDCIDGLNFFFFVSTFTSIAATPKTVSSPPGVDKFKEELLKKYEGKLDDPVAYVEFEKEIDAFDADYLKDDPAAKAIFGNKAKSSRRRMHYNYGKGLDFVEDTTAKGAVEPPLSKGLDVSKENMPKYLNDLRYASFSRGGNTALSGYTYKILQRSLSGIKISSTPCNTTKGVVRFIQPKQAGGLLNRYIKMNGKWHLVKDKEELKNYIGKTIEVRSPMFCKTEGDAICYACVSESFKGSESGTTNIAAGISSVMMSMFLKLMHGSVTESVEIDIKDLCS